MKICCRLILNETYLTNSQWGGLITAYIKSLVRKPQAFRYSQIRDDLLPTDQYKQIWSYVDENIGGKPACKLIVGLLYLAAEADCEKRLADHVLELINSSLPIDLNKIQELYMPKTAEIPPVQVEQHSLKSYDDLVHLNFIFNNQRATPETIYA